MGLVAFAVLARYIGLWVQCKLTGTRIGLWDLVMMSVRKVNPTVITRSLIMATQAGLLKDYSLTRKQLEAHYLANGNVPNVIKSAHRRPAGEPVDGLEHRRRDRPSPAGTCWTPSAPASIRR